MMKKKCRFCEEKAVYYRSVSGEFLCKTHFIKSFEKKFRMTVRRFKLFTPLDSIAVGVSGGKDSLALLENIWLFQKDNPKSPPIQAILIDEGIQGYREESLNIAKKFCKERDITLHIVSFYDYFGSHLDNLIPLLKKKKVNACTICGTVRRRLLNEKARELGADVLAIGHNLDDTVQTFLQNILRNDIQKIALNPPYGNPKDKSGSLVPRVKPLIEIPEEEIVRYCFYKGIPIQSRPCPYTENFSILRKKIQEFLYSLEQHSHEIKYNLLKANLDMVRSLYASGIKNLRKKPLPSIKNNINKSSVSLKDPSIIVTEIESAAPSQNRCRICGEYCGPKRDLCFYCELKEKFIHSLKE